MHGCTYTTGTVYILHIIIIIIVFRLFLTDFHQYNISGYPQGLMHRHRRRRNRSGGIHNNHTCSYTRVHNRDSEMEITIYHTQLDIKFQTFLLK